MAIYENKGEYLLIKPSAAYSEENYKKAIREARAFCEQYGLTKILADVRGRNEVIPAADRFEIGVEIANVLGGKFQFAILAPAGIIDKLGENAAVNRGGNVFVTSSRAKALRWLGVK
jgi:hypothetical protein